MVPEGWKIKSLGEICDGNLQTGPFGSQLHANEYTASGTPVLMPKDFVDGKVNLSGAAKISHNRASDLSKHKLQTGDLLFSRRGDVTRFALITEDVAGALCGTGCLRARPSSKHTPLFLAYFLQKNAVQKWLEQNAVGQTMPNMNTAILSELPLMVSTNTAEEEEIARILSTWDKAIETVEKLIENSRAQKKALMQQLLTGKRRLPGFDGVWKDYHLIDVSNILVSPVDKKTIEGEKSVLLCNYTDVYYNTRITKSLNFMQATATDREIDKFTLTVGDVLITKDSETPGDIAVPAYVSEDLECVVCGYHLAILRPKKEIVDGEFLSYLLSLEKTRYYFFTLATGATRFGLSVGSIQMALLNLPPLKEQQEIASVLTTADKEIDTLQQKLDCLKQEKKALMQQLLTGKRRVQIN